ncbi:MAG: hypothetical protein BJ554DRAFT_830 [Olpidium bornovanus]|uniref:Transmembrane protein n=1 Tax=Olpidium bornovanus TaxID=278681 RepID=A0A8H7ZTA6_9FUNG|nr:MAG: hypothetical protein BJ554DRAFT_830 [Olpidium bornovanus]
MDVEENLDSPAPSDEKGQSEPESARSTSVPSRKSRNLRDSRDLEESARQSVAGAPRRGMHGRTPSITSATEDRGANVRSRRGDLQATSSFAGVDGSGVSEGHSHAEPGKNEAEALNRGYSGEKGDDLAIPQPSHRPFRELPIGAAIPKKDRATSSQGLSPLSSWAASSAALAELAEPLQSSESPDGDHERTGKNGQFFDYYRRSLGSLRCEWSPASLDPCTLRFRTAAQERSYHAQYLADSARDALVSVYMVTLFVMCGNVLAELASDGTIVGRTAYSVGVVAAAIGLLTVCAWKGRLFVDNYLSPEPEDVGEEDCEHDNDDGPAEDPLVKSAGGTSAKPISQKRGSLSIGATADRGTAKRRHARKRRGYCCPRDRRYLVLTPLAVLFFLNMAPFDLRCADEAVAVTGSFLPYVILLSSAGMGVAFTQPVVWFPLGVASAVFVCRSAVTTVAAVYMLRGLPHPFGGSLRALPAQFPNAIPTDSLLADAGEMTASLEKRTLIDIRIPAESENAVSSLLPNVAVSIGKITASGEAANPRGRDATGQPATSRRLSGNRQLSGQVAQVSRKASPPTGGSVSDKSASEVPHVGLPARQAATAPAEPDPQAATAPAELDPQTATAPAEPDPQATTAPAEPDPQAATAPAEPDPQAATAPAEPKPQAAPPSSGKALQGELELQNQQSTTPVPLFSLVLKVLAFNFVQFGPVFVAVALAFRFGKSKERESRML